MSDLYEKNRKMFRAAIEGESASVIDKIIKKLFAKHHWYDLDWEDLDIGEYEEAVEKLNATFKEAVDSPTVAGCCKACQKLCDIMRELTKPPAPEPKPPKGKSSGRKDSGKGGRGSGIGAPLEDTDPTEYDKPSEEDEDDDEDGYEDDEIDGDDETGDVRKTPIPDIEGA